MGAQRSLTSTLIRQGIKAFRQFRKQVTLLVSCLCLVFNSPFTSSFRAVRCLGVRSDISSLSYNVNSQNSGPPLQK